MAIELTKAAAQHIRDMLAKRGSGIGLRLGTRKSGCSGFAYVVDYADAVDADDVVFEANDVKIVVNKDSLPVLEGMQLDYVKNNALNEGFEFINPNVTSMCGCGESFST